MEPPDVLTPAALKEWHRILGSGAVIADLDCGVLAAYCQNYARWQDAERLIAEHGAEIIIRDDKGIVKNAVPSPQIGIARGAFQQMLAAASHLGLKARGSSGRPMRQITRTVNVGMKSRKVRASVN